MEKNNNFLVSISFGCVIGLNIALHFVQKDVEELQEEVACQSDSIKQLREEVNNFYKITNVVFKEVNDYGNKTKYRRNSKG